RDRTRTIVPGAVGADLHADIAAVGRMPAVDRRPARSGLRRNERLQTLDARDGVGGHLQSGKRANGRPALVSGLVRATFIIIANRLYEPMMPPIPPPPRAPHRSSTRP